MKKKEILDIISSAKVNPIHSTLEAPILMSIYVINNKYFALECFKEMLKSKLRDWAVKLYQIAEIQEFADDDGRTAGHIVAKYGDAELIRYFFEIMPHIFEIPDIEGSYPIHCAAKSGNFGAMRALIDIAGDSSGPIKYFKDIENREEKNGYTPLALAVKYGRIEVADLLLLSGADPNIYSWNGDTPLKLAAENDDINMWRLLRDRGASWDKDADDYLLDLFSDDCRDAIEDYEFSGEGDSESTLVIELYVPATGETFEILV